MKILCVLLLLSGCASDPLATAPQPEKQQPDDAKTMKTFHDFFNPHD